MVEAAIELVEHPGGTGIDQQGGGALDQVVIGEPPLALLPRGQIGEHGLCEREQRARGLHHAERAALVGDPGHPALLGEDRVPQGGVGVQQLPVGEGGHSTRRTGAGEQLVAPTLPMLGALRRIEAEPAQHAGRLLAHRGGAVLPDQQQAGAQRRLARPGHRARDDVALAFAAKPGGARDRRVARPSVPGEERAEPGPAFLEPRQLADESLRRQQGGRGLERRRDIGRRRREHGLARLVQREAGIGVLEQAEMRGERGLEREAAEQGLAEGVDGADPHAARQVEHAGEQGARIASLVSGVGSTWSSREPGVEIRVVERHPFAEPALQPHRHLRGGGLGEGEALDALGRRAGEHEAEQAIGQELRLPRPRGGGDEGGDLGVGGAALLGFGARARAAQRGAGDVVHAPSPAASHSATRASWA